MEEIEVIRRVIASKVQEIIDLTDNEAIIDALNVILDGVSEIDRLHSEMALEALKSSDEYIKQQDGGIAF